MRRTIRLALLTSAIAMAPAAQAQMTPRPLAVDIPRDECARLTDPAAISSCGLSAVFDFDYTTAVTAFNRTAQVGNYVDAFRLAEIYAGGYLGNKDFVTAYKWYDIAAAIHSKRFGATRRAATDGNNEDYLAINFMTAAARHLSAAQIDDALKQSHEWQAQYLHHGETH